MSFNPSITAVLNGSVHTVHRMIPLEIKNEEPSLLDQTYMNGDLGVLIGMTGDLACQLLIEGSEASFSLIGERMYGLPMEGEMLSSFTAELGNMIAGNLATHLLEHEVTIDITTPTLVGGNKKLEKSREGFHVPLSIEKEHQLSLILLIERT
ncbi:chemotaxis protein CheX [Halobacillus sp. Nhm2S1]|uniref:chemotaxis protein CheX n=1 Tax=Halobacillus sp. Nhm2S1 TaxID=2866716 RepID=UPI001C737501|nr:chemotaxis protein CheX [Halobacillus sp. Nhm2S1]MBX0356267.1 chemotaxis protein CheX [Halobacillus sp. Nhm2S1]